MGRSRSDIRQGDIQRALKAAKNAGLDVVRVEVDPKSPKFVLVVKDDGNEMTTINPFDHAPTPWSARRQRK